MASRETDDPLHYKIAEICEALEHFINSTWCRSEMLQSTTVFLVTMSISLYAFADAAAVFDRNFTKPYVLKKTWVQNFIKFQYIFEGKQGKAKIVPLGCAPDNVDSENYLKPGEQSRQHDFLFSCEEGEDGVLNYEAVACIDAFGQTMHPGETRRLSNGTVVLHCNIFGGALKKVVERAAGCYFNETIFGEDEKWVEPQVHQNDTSIDGRLMQCFRPHYSYYESHVVGCVIGRLGILVDEFGQLSDGSFVKCVEVELGHVTLKPANVEELACVMDNTTHPHETKWLDRQRGANMRCNFGHIVKESCMVGNETLPIGQEVPVSRDCIFLCHPQTNVYICDNHLDEFVVVDNNDDFTRPIETIDGRSGVKLITKKTQKSLKSVLKI